MEIKCAHRGGFQGRGPRPGRPVNWLVELWRPYPDGEGPGMPRELRFPADSPLEIEWDEWKPEEPVQGSMLTLRIESMADREFIDYYTTQAGKFFIKVYRCDCMRTSAWELVWRGSLDPEFYEEPYQRANGYDVTLTFSDFGALDRIDFLEFGGPRGYTTDGMFYLLDMIGMCISVAGMADPGDGSVFGLKPMTTVKLLDFDGEEYPLAESLSKIRLPFANFKNEEGEPVSWQEALKRILLPLGLHIVQRGGRVLLYDTDYIVRQSDDADWPMINWSGDSQTLSVGQTYNNIKITFSPYLRTNFLEDKIEPDLNSSRRIDMTIGNYIKDPLKASDSLRWNYYRSFKLTRTKTGSGAKFVYNEQLPYFKITPLAGSVSECTGLMFPQLPEFKGTYGEYGPTRTLFTLPPVYVPPAVDTTQMSLVPKELLLLSMEMLYDPRFNPFEPADPGIKGASNNADEWEQFEKIAGWISVPLRVVLRDESGRVTHVYNNLYEFNQIHDGQADTVNCTFPVGRWVEYDRAERDVPNGLCYAQWYDSEEGKPAISGWTTNRPTIGIWPWAREMMEYHKHGPRGMLMEYPRQGGFIEISVLDGVLIHRRRTYSADTAIGSDERYPRDASGGYLHPVQSVLPKDAQFMSKCRWRAFRNVSLKIIGGGSGEWNEPTFEDVVTEGAVNTNARENLELELTCGAVREPKTGMLGLYQLPTGPVWAMERAGEKNYIERILIGSLFSQYAYRRLALTGEATETTMRLPVFRDHNSPGMFIVARSRLKALEGVEEITMINVFADNYMSEPIEPRPEYEFRDVTDDRNREPEFDSSADLPFGPESEDPEEQPDPGDIPDPWDDDDPDWDDRWDDYDRYD